MKRLQFIVTTTNKVRKFLFEANNSEFDLVFNRSKPEPRKLNIAMTIHADGSITKYDGPIDAVPVNTNSLQSEVGAFLSDKKISKPGCNFDVSSQTCVCGHSLNDFLSKTCNNKK